jgi:hypothetical protein
MRHWTHAEYQLLFENWPPTDPSAPPQHEGDRLAQALHRTTGAVVSQWNDARSTILGNKSAASRQLLSYLRSRGWTS